MKSIITIDGPSGVGKSTVSRKVAAATGFTYLDTGAMYRGVGLFLQEEGIDLQDHDRMVQALDGLRMELLPAVDEDSDVGVVLNGVDVSSRIRTPAMAMVASQVSAVGIVRDILTEMQREYGVKGKIVAEGRDTGTVVFPDAAYKFYLDATPEVRAARRYSQLIAKGVAANLEQLLAQTIERDRNDSERRLSPLRPAEDALIVDTTRLTIQEVVATILERLGTVKPSLD